MTHDYTEDQLVEQPAIKLFAELSWTTVSALEEVFGVAGTLGRETSGEVVLLSRLHAALEKLNPSLPREILISAADELTRDRSAMSLEAANREVYLLLKEGIKVSVPDIEHGGQRTERLRVVDWADPENNDFLLVSQFSVTGPLYTCRPDLVGFVNGLPLVVIELKKPGVPARAAFDENLTSYKHPQNGIASLFWYNAFLIASNGTDSRVGSLTSDWDRFFEWKRIERENEPRRVSLEVMIRGTCDRARLLDLVENFTLFSEHTTGLIKIIGQNHQFLGVNNAISSMLTARKVGNGQAGVFWQTQGSGKSFSMVFFAQKVLRKVAGNWTFVVVTDRVELDDQIAKTFKAVGAVSEAEGDQCHATSGAHLRELLRGNHRYVFTLIHKFQTPEMLCDRPDVIVLTDEAHRSQYDTLALNMRAALPKALFLAFTGTPLIAGEERTKEVFGDYVSIYDFQQSVEDNATVPLYYENRAPELRLVNPDFGEDIYDVIESAGLDDDQEQKLREKLGRQYQLLTRESRLDDIAKDIVRHFLGRGFPGKAMVVSIDKATALKMHDKVRFYWEVERKKTEADLAALHGRGELEKTQQLRARLELLATTDMAVVVSPGQNEIEQLRKLGLDIIPHRERMNREPMDEKFKDPQDPLRLVFLCAMWLTGFDAPSCSTVYLDKPMRNHTLMQTIARANRVYGDKGAGFIVDYCNVFASLEKALAIYGAGHGGRFPVRDKKALAEELRKAVAEAVAFARTQGVDVHEITEAGAGLVRLKLLGEAVERLISPETVRRKFLGLERLAQALFSNLKPDTSALEFSNECSCLTAIADTIRARLNGGENEGDLAGVLSQINDILDKAIVSKGFELSDAKGKIDLSKINLKVLQKRFAKTPYKKVELERLRTAIQARIERLLRLNKTRVDWLMKFQALVEAYNSGSRTVDQLFKELLDLGQLLTEEEKRHVRENLTEEQLAIFDILTRPGPDLKPDEAERVKKVARHLLERIHALLVLDWRRKTGTRAQVQLAIEETLDDLPEPYSKDIFETKCRRVFEHVFECYQDDGRSVYDVQYAFQ